MSEPLDPPDPSYDPSLYSDPLSWADMRAFLLEHGHEKVVSEIEKHQVEGHWYNAVNPRTKKRQLYRREVSDKEMVYLARQALEMLSQFNVDVLLALATFERDHQVTIKFESD